ncbi:MAG TPA: hypothetical protein P5081_07925 [Phycisphaerae bacterium]|nr:hypothetical protein [Phycisphaerae bacterium]HRW52800.1 hypothetical protein [Phycisphaerae bacterium]
MKSIAVIPLFGVLLVIYNIIMLTGDATAVMAKPMVSATLISGAAWSMSAGEMLIAAGLFVLFAEMFKATRTGTSSILDHALSMLVFVVFVVEFLVAKEAGNSTFLILGLMSLVDVIAGFSITIVAARRDLAVGTPVS